MHACMFAGNGDGVEVCRDGSDGAYDALGPQNDARNGEGDLSCSLVEGGVIPNAQRAADGPMKDDSETSQPVDDPILRHHEAILQNELGWVQCERCRTWRYYVSEGGEEEDPFDCAQLPKNNQGCRLQKKKKEKDWREKIGLHFCREKTGLTVDMAPQYPLFETSLRSMLFDIEERTKSFWPSRDVDDVILEINGLSKPETIKQMTDEERLDKLRSIFHRVVSSVNSDCWNGDTSCNVIIDGIGKTHTTLDLYGLGVKFEEAINWDYDTEEDDDVDEPRSRGTAIRKKDRDPDYRPTGRASKPRTKKDQKKNGQGGSSRTSATFAQVEFAAPAARDEGSSRFRSDPPQQPLAVLRAGDAASEDAAGKENKASGLLDAEHTVPGQDALGLSPADGTAETRGTVGRQSPSHPSGGGAVEATLSQREVGQGEGGSSHGEDEQKFDEGGEGADDDSVAERDVLGAGGGVEVVARDDPASGRQAKRGAAGVAEDGDGEAGDHGLGGTEACEGEQHDEDTPSAVGSGIQQSSDSSALHNGPIHGVRACVFVCVLSVCLSVSGRDEGGCSVHARACANHAC